MSSNDENAGGQVVEVEFSSYRKPVLELYDFGFRLEPRRDEQTGELVGVALELGHPADDAGRRYLFARLVAVELATGILSLVDSHDQTKGGDNASE